MKVKSDTTQTSFFRMFFSLCLPLVLQNVITLGVNLADNIMLGSFSETALSGAAAVNQVQFVYQQLLMALGDGIVMICSQYWGRRQTGPMKKIMAFGIRIALGIALALFLAVSFFPAQVLHLFTTDAAITAEGIRYLNIIRFSYLFFAVTQICLACLRSVGTVRIASFVTRIRANINSFQAVIKAMKTGMVFAVKKRQKILRGLAV